MDTTPYIPVLSMGILALTILGVLIGLAVGLTIGIWPRKGWIGNSLLGAITGGLLLVFIVGLDFLIMPVAIFILDVVFSPIGFAVLAVSVAIGVWREGGCLADFTSGFGIRGRTVAFFLGVVIIIFVSIFWVSDCFAILTGSARDTQPETNENAEETLWVSGAFEHFKPAHVLDASGRFCRKQFIGTNKG